MLPSTCTAHSAIFSECPTCTHGECDRFGVMSSAKAQGSYESDCDGAKSRGLGGEMRARKRGRGARQAGPPDLRCVKLLIITPLYGPETARAWLLLRQAIGFPWVPRAHKRHRAERELDRRKNQAR